MVFSRTCDLCPLHLVGHRGNNKLPRRLTHFLILRLSSAVSSIETYLSNRTYFPFSFCDKVYLQVQSNLDISKLMGLFFTSSNYPGTVKTVICDLHLDLGQKVTYDRGSLKTISIYLGERFGAG